MAKKFSEQEQREESEREMVEWMLTKTLRHCFYFQLTLPIVINCYKTLLYKRFHSLTSENININIGIPQMQAIELLTIKGCL